MPTISPVSPSQQPPGGFPFPSVATSPKEPLTAIMVVEPPVLGPTTVATILDWPHGPPLKAFDYTALSKSVEVNAALDRIVDELGQWLASVDAGMTQILDESA